MAGQKGMKHYPLEFRQKIVDLHISKGLSLSQLAQDYNIARDRVALWCRWQKQYGVPKQITGKKKGRPKIRTETLEEEVKRLRMENEVLKKFHELLMEETKRR